MAKRRASASPPEIGPPQVSPAQGLQLLQVLIEKGKGLLNSRPIAEDAHDSWELLARNYLEKAFGVNSPNVASVVDVGKYGSFPMGASEIWWENHRAESLASQIARLEGLVELLSTELQLSGGKPVHAEVSQTGHSVFLVHGHDEAILHELARFLERLEQEVIVLREQPNEGRTIIEKFETFANAGFAIVLLTPDDRGGEIATPYEKQKPRPRQNVLFEFGYFIGRLGRNRVCALYREGVELPSDYSGVIYIKIDEHGGWRLSVAKEMKAAGLTVDLNKAI